MTAIQTAVELAGTPTALARLLADRNVKRQHVEHWLKMGRVPAEHCPSIERVLNRRVTCEQLRADVEWAVLRREAANDPAAAPAASPAAPT